MTRKDKIVITVFIILALLFLFSIPIKIAYPQSTQKKCSLTNRPEFAMDAKSGKMVPVGVDRWFVVCYNSVTVKGKEKRLHPQYLKGDLGGYGYYAKYEDAAKAAYDFTNPKQETQP